MSGLSCPKHHAGIFPIDFEAGSADAKQVSYGSREPPKKSMLMKPWIFPPPNTSGREIQTQDCLPQRGAPVSAPPDPEPAPVPPGGRSDANLRMR